MGKFVGFFDVWIIDDYSAVVCLGTQRIYIEAQEDVFWADYVCGGYIHGAYWPTDAQGVTKALWEFVVTRDRACSEGRRRLPLWQDTPWG